MKPYDDWKQNYARKIRPTLGAECVRSARRLGPRTKIPEKTPGELVRVDGFRGWTFSPPTPEVRFPFLYEACFENALALSLQ